MATTEFLMAGGTVPFVAALILMLLIGVVEAVGLGGGFVADGGAADSEVGEASLLSWLNMGRLPALMLAVVFLFSFGVVGLVGQRIIAAASGQPGPWFLAVPLAFAVALPMTRLLGRALSRVLPTDETTAVSRDSLVGRLATIVTGEARSGSAAQARVRDAHGQPHYVMVEPDDDGDVFAQGSSVLIVRQGSARYFAIPDPSASLMDRLS